MTTNSFHGVDALDGAAWLSELTAGWLESDLFAEVDPVAILPALASTGAALWARPDLVVAATVNGLTALATTSVAAFARAYGLAPVDDGPSRDRRFADPAWRDSPSYWWARQTYLAWGEAMVDLVRAADVPAATRRKAEFAVQLLVDAASPSNSPLNPAVVKRSFETGGGSLARGGRTFLHDLVHHGGRPAQAAAGAYQVGHNLAVTPGKVVFRNDLMELIQYAPSTPQVHEIPLLVSPPWINKYYILDLAPGRSLVEWAVDHGHTVFMISYRNPDESMRDVTMDDYLVSGPVEALRVVADITRAERVNLLSLCLGGTLGMAALCYLNAGEPEKGLPEVNSATFLNTLVDFSEPGPLGVFTDEITVRRLEQSMAGDGFLPKEKMQASFNVLRSNDLVWNYVVNSWLMGEAPPAFDLLSWNGDSTRMPAAMHSFYLRSCYLENRLAGGTMELAGRRLDPTAVEADLYFLAAELDHIAPWRSSYAGARLPRGDVRFVLSNAGHIAGIVNPPNPASQKSVSQHRVGDGGALPADPDEWLGRATTHRETWWQDWARWIDQRAGGLRRPPRFGSRRNRPLGDAPGTYVLET